MFDRTFSGALGPHFAHLKQIGGGGNGLVYSGVDTRSDFPICIKRVSVTDKNDCRAVLREIRIRRRLRHENIVGLLNAITSDGTDVSEIAPANFRDTSCIYLVQELLDADLHQVIESNNRLIDDYVKLFFYQLLRGLKYIHSANVLHRDLKPSNVVINVNSLELMIGDFGHSMVLDPEYNHSNCLSSCNTSLWYKAPELILGSSRYSTASDMWSVGCILAEMLLGRPLFEGENDLEQLELIIHTIEINERDQVHVRQFLTEEVNKMYTGRPKFPLRSKFQKVDFHAFHLLERLLAFNPGDRVTAELALSHPFLEEYSCPADEPVCVKPLHVEHEVDDFLEYTLKDLIVGECVALAEEQPRIHRQMSSYSSLMDIVKELNDSPTEAIHQSVEDGKNAISIKVTSESERGNPNDGGDGRFKVLEVLKEEHQSSSDSNGIPSHEEGVSEEPLVSDHPTFSSLKWENERHKFGHRRHHTHHRRKSSGEDSSRSRKRKVSPGNKVHKNPNSECEIPEGQVPLVLSPGDNAPGSVSSYPSSSSESRLSPGEHFVRASDSDLGSGVVREESQDGKFRELVDKSQESVKDLRDGSTDRVCGGLGPGKLVNSLISKEFNREAGQAREQQLAVNNFDYSSSEKGADSKFRKDESYCAADASVADLIRRSRELLGEGDSSASSEEEQVVVEDKKDPVKDLISKSEQLLSSLQAEIGGETQGQSDKSADHTVFGHTVEHPRESPQSPVTESSAVSTLQPLLSDPYHLRESNRRMQELFQESHTLLSNLRTDPELKTNSGISSSPLHDGESRGLPNGLSARLNAFSAQQEHIHDIASENLTANPKVLSEYGTEVVRPESTGDKSNEHCKSQAKTFDHEIDFDEMRAVVSKAKQLLDQAGESYIAAEDRGPNLDHPLPCPEAKIDALAPSPLHDSEALVRPAGGSARQKNVKLADEVQRNGESELVKELEVGEGNTGKRDLDCLTTVEISQYQNPVSYCRVSSQDFSQYPCPLEQHASVFEPVTVKHSVEYIDKIMVNKSFLHGRKAIPTKYPEGEINDDKHPSALGDVVDIANNVQDVPADAHCVEDSLKRKSIECAVVPERRVVEFDLDDGRGLEVLTNDSNFKCSVTVAGDEEAMRVLRNDDTTKAEQRSFKDRETKNVDKTSENNREEELSRAAGTISPNFSVKNGTVHPVPNGFLYKEISILQNKNCKEYAPKHAFVKLNNGITGPRNSFDGKYRCDTIKQAPILEKQLKDVANKQLIISEEKQNKVNKTSAETYSNGTESCIAITDKLTSGDLVGNICRNKGRIEKKAMGYHGDHHSKDDAGLKNFYATIKIKSLMNRSRTYRDKLHEPYPF